MVADQIMKASTGAIAKRIATDNFKTPHFFSQQSFHWELDNLLDHWKYSISSKVCQQIFHTKWEQCAAFRDKLMSTGDAQIIHPVPDKRWGTGSNDPYSVTGKGGLNLIGKLLMKF